MSSPGTRTSNPRLSARRDIKQEDFVSAKVSSCARVAPTPGTPAAVASPTGPGGGSGEAPWLGLAPPSVLIHPSHCPHGTSGILPDSSDGLGARGSVLPPPPADTTPSVAGAPAANYSLDRRGLRASRRGLGAEWKGGPSPPPSGSRDKGPEPRGGWLPRAAPQAGFAGPPPRGRGEETRGHRPGITVWFGEGKAGEGVFSLRWKFLLCPGGPRAGSRLGGACTSSPSQGDGEWVAASLSLTFPSCRPRGWARTPSRDSPDSEHLYL